MLRLSLAQEVHNQSRRRFQRLHHIERLLRLFDGFTVHFLNDISLLQINVPVAGIARIEALDEPTLEAMVG